MSDFLNDLQKRLARKSTDVLTVVRKYRQESFTPFKKGVTMESGLSQKCILNALMT